jgi:hypothetical protein
MGISNRDCGAESQRLAAPSSPGLQLLAPFCSFLRLMSGPTGGQWALHDTYHIKDVKEPGRAAPPPSSGLMMGTLQPARAAAARKLSDQSEIPAKKNATADEPLLIDLDS